MYREVIKRFSIQNLDFSCHFNLNPTRTDESFQILVTFSRFMRHISINQHTIIMRQDRQLLVITHLSQLLCFITGFGSLIVPLILWATQKERVYQMDEQGKEIVNFQLSLIVYLIICIPLILLLGLGIIGIIVLGIISLVYPIINAIRASNGESPKYPLSLNFIS